MLEDIYKLIENAELKPSNFPPTLIYNEGWMLRLILDWYSKHNLPNHPLLFHPHATWFSEAQLPSHFRPRYRGDTRGEARTHADGIVGHFSVGKMGKADIKLNSDATQLIIIEAKMYSHLSGGTRNAPGFDQASRSVACITELLFRSNHSPLMLKHLAFYVIAPEVQINSDIFSKKLNKESIKASVQKRIREFMPDLDVWIDKWFIPTLETIQIKTLSWESLINDVVSIDLRASRLLQVFYEKCLIYNR